MLFLKFLTSGLGKEKRRLDLGLVLGVIGLIAVGGFAYSGESRGEKALRVELADLNVRQADQRNDQQELLKALAQVTARVAALEQEAAARLLPGIPPEVLETGSVGEPSPTEKPMRRTKRKSGGN